MGEHTDKTEAAAKTSDVIVGTGKRKLKTLSWKFVLMAAIAFAMAAAAGVAVRWVTTRSPSQSQGAPATLPKAAKDVQDLRTSGKVEEAAKKLEAGLADPSASSETRYLLYIQQGNLESDKANLKAAIAAYEQAAAIDVTYEVTTILGDTYKLDGNKAKAIENYKKAITLIPVKSPLRDADKESLEGRIHDLEAQP